MELNELNELKNTWTVLDEQLKKNETLNKQILQTMLHKKSNKSLSKLSNTDFISVIVLLLVIPFCIWLYNSLYFKIFLSVRILSVTGIIFSVMGLILYYYKLKYLIKMDFSNNVKDNMFCVNRYEIMVKYEKIASYIQLPIIASLAAFCYYEFRAGFLSWTFLFVCVAIGVAITLWMFKKFYYTHIQSIKKNLLEMKQLLLPLAVFCMLLSTVSCNSDRAQYVDLESIYEQNLQDSTLATGWYYILENGDGFKRQLDKTGEFYFIDPKPIVVKEHFDKVFLYQPDFHKDGVALSMQIHKKYQELWADATEKSIGKRLGFIVDDKLVSAPMVNMKIENGMSSLYGYSRRELEGFKKNIISL